MTYETNKTKKKYVCDGCDLAFGSKCNLDRHINSCKIYAKICALRKEKEMLNSQNIIDKQTMDKIFNLEKNNAVNKKTIQLLKEKVSDNEKNYKQIVEQEKEKVDILKKENEFHRSVMIGLNSNGKNKSINTLTFVTTNYNTAPSLIYQKEKFDFLVILSFLLAILFNLNQGISV